MTEPQIDGIPPEYSQRPPDAKTLDAAYVPFPSFADWAKSTTVDLVRYDRYSSQLEEVSRTPPEILRRARDIAKRAAAVDTGAIEDLYDVDRGFTFTVALETATWEAAATAKGEQFRVLFESQLQAYDYVMDFATRTRPIAAAWIRELHVAITRGQETYPVHTGVGVQNQALPKGAYKLMPNHVIRRDGAPHAYAPVEMTAPEMERLVAELNGAEFVKANPVQQAAYAHYAFVAIHPFADGNGRVARALASIFTYRAHSIPLVILLEHRPLYYEALARSDDGLRQPFVDFVLDRTLDSIQLVYESIRSAVAPSPKEEAQKIASLYVTRGGFSHEQIDAAGFALLIAFEQQLSLASKEHVQKEEQLTIHVQRMNGTYGSALAATHRAPVPRSQQPSYYLQLSARTGAPAAALVQRMFHLLLPKDSAADDDILIHTAQSGETFGVRVADILGGISGVVQIRLQMHAERILGQVLKELAGAAEVQLRR